VVDHGILDSFAKDSGFPIPMKLTRFPTLPEVTAVGVVTLWVTFGLVPVPDDVACG
jgi:hypothetical protein